MNNPNDTSAADLPPAPNGHGASNGAPANETRQTAADDVTKDVTPSSKKKKNKKGRQHDQKLKFAGVESTMTTAAVNQSVSVEPNETTEPTAPHKEAMAAPIKEPVEATIEEAAAAPIELPATAPIEESAAAPVEEPATAPIETPTEGLKLRLKVWTDPATAKRYLMPSAFMRDIVNGQPMSDVMYAYAMSDEDTKLVTLTASEWNALPFYYFQEDGPAPRATARPVDVLFSREGTA